MRRLPVGFVWVRCGNGVVRLYARFAVIVPRRTVLRPGRIDPDEARICPRPENLIYRPHKAGSALIGTLKVSEEARPSRELSVPDRPRR
jgi:hypothetical protein